MRKFVEVYNEKKKEYEKRTGERYDPRKGWIKKVPMYKEYKLTK